MTFTYIQCYVVRMSRKHKGCNSQAWPIKTQFCDALGPYQMILSIMQIFDDFGSFVVLVLTDRQMGKTDCFTPLLCMRTWDYKASLVLLYSTCITAYHAMTDLKFGSCTALSSSSLWLKHRNCHYQGQESQTPSPWLRHRHCVHWRPFTICAITVCSYWHAGDMISVSFQIATRDLTRDAFTTSPVAA